MSPRAAPAAPRRLLMLDDNVRALRLLVVAAVALDAASTFRDLRVTDGLSVAGVATTLQLVLTPVAAALVMWLRPRAAAAVVGVVMGLALVNRPTSEELWLLLVVAVVVTARARLRVVLLVAAAELGYAVLLAARTNRRFPGEGPTTALVVVSFCVAGHGCGVVVRRVLRAQERRRRRLDELERENETIRRTERRRLADDLQTVVTGGLAAVQRQLDQLSDPSTDGPALRRGLDRIDRESRAVLSELRGLLDVLRRDDPLPAGVELAGPGMTQRLLAALTARPVRLATTAVSVLLALRAAGGWWTATPEAAVAVQVLGWTALALVVWLPRAGALVAVVALAVSVGAATPDDWDALPVALLFFVGALRLRPSRLWVLAGALAAYAVLLALTAPAWADRLLVASYAAAVATVAGLAAGHFVGLERTARSQREGLLDDRDQLAPRERSAAARELHDVVAHQLSLTTLMIMATSASSDREELGGTLRRIEDYVETTDRELVALLQTMRGDDTDDVRPSPLVLPSAGAASFARRLSASGFWPEVAVDPAADDLDATTQRTLGRIMQEATTNIVRYAPPGSSCAYALAVAGDRVRLTVTNPLRERTAASTLSLGWGLRGVAERVQLSHGAFSAGVHDGRWVVDVSLPHLAERDPRPPAASVR